MLSISLGLAIKSDKSGLVILLLFLLADYWFLLAEF